MKKPKTSNKDCCLFTSFASCENRIVNWIIGFTIMFFIVHKPRRLKVQTITYSKSLKGGRPMSIQLGFKGVVIERDQENTNAFFPQSGLLGNKSTTEFQCFGLLKQDSTQVYLQVISGWLSVSYQMRNYREMFFLAEPLKIFIEEKTR